MNEMRTKAKNDRGSRGIFWMLVPVGLLGFSVVGWIVMVSKALDDPGFSLEPDYYKKAAHYDEELAQRRTNRELGWSAKLDGVAIDARDRGLLVIQMKSAVGTALSDVKVTVETFAVARGKEIQHVECLAAQPGTYECALDHVRQGLWEVRLTAERNGLRFTENLRAEFGASEVPPT